MRSPSLSLATKLLVLFGLACNGPSTSVDAGAGEDGGATDGGAPEPARGPSVLAIAGDPNGLFWDDSDRVLYVADDNNNRILRWTDADGFMLAADLLPAPPEGAGLGQVLRLEDGTLVVTRFGHGTAGAVLFVTPSGEPGIVRDIDPERRRIGLTVDAEGRLYTSWFVRRAGAPRIGAVGRLDLAGTEPEVITGLTKPVGVLALGDFLYVADQDQNQVFRAPRADPSALTSFAVGVEAPDLLTAGPDGGLFSGGADGVVTEEVIDGGSIGGAVALRWWLFDVAVVSGALYVTRYDVPPLEQPEDPLVLARDHQCQRVLGRPAGASASAPHPSRPLWASDRRAPHRRRGGVAGGSGARGVGRARDARGSSAPAARHEL